MDSIDLDFVYYPGSLGGTQQPKPNNYNAFNEEDEDNEEELKEEEEGKKSGQVGEGKEGAEDAASLLNNDNWINYLSSISNQKYTFTVSERLSTIYTDLCTYFNPKLHELFFFGGGYGAFLLRLLAGLLEIQGLVKPEIAREVVGYYLATGKNMMNIGNPVRIQFMGLFDSTPNTINPNAFRFFNIYRTMNIQSSCHIMASKPTSIYDNFSYHCFENEGGKNCFLHSKTKRFPNFANAMNIVNHLEYRAIGDHEDICGGWKNTSTTTTTTSSRAAMEKEHRATVMSIANKTLRQMINFSPLSVLDLLVDEHEYPVPHTSTEWTRLTHHILTYEHMKHQLPLYYFYQLCAVNSVIPMHQCKSMYANSGICVDLSLHQQQQEEERRKLKQQQQQQQQQQRPTSPSNTNTNMKKGASPGRAARMTIIGTDRRSTGGSHSRPSSATTSTGGGGESSRPSSPERNRRISMIPPPSRSRPGSATKEKDKDKMSIDMSDTTRESLYAYLTNSEEEFLHQLKRTILQLHDLPVPIRRLMLARLT